jgi:NitT/TauT family transport system permease protein
VSFDQPSQLASRATSTLYAGIGIGVALGAWALLTGLEIVPETSLPAPWTVLSTMVDEFDVLAPDLWVTTKAFLFALGLSLTVGLALGIAIVDSKLLSRVLYPIIVSSQVVPKITLGPIIMVWFGFGILSTALVGALIAVFPAVLGTVVGLRSVRPEKIHLTRTMGAGWLRTLVRVRLPSALPDILPGVRLAAILSILGVLVGEYIGADEGIGKRILEASAAFNADVVFAASAYVVLMGFAVFAIMTAIDARATHWNRTGRRTGTR